MEIAQFGSYKEDTKTPINLSHRNKPIAISMLSEVDEDAFSSCLIYWVGQWYEKIKIKLTI